MNEWHPDSSQPWSVNYQELDALIAMWAGWYSFHHHFWLDGGTFSCSFSVDVSGNAQSILKATTTLPPGYQETHFREQAALKSPAIPLNQYYENDKDQRGNVDLVALLEHLQAAKLERVQLTLLLGSLDIRRTTGQDLKLDENRVYALSIRGQFQQRRFLIQRIMQHGPGLSKHSQEVTVPLHSGLQIFQEARGQAYTAYSAVSSSPTTGRRSYHFLCRNEAEATALTKLAYATQMNRGLATAGHIILTDMQPDLELPICVSYVRLGQKTNLFREETFQK